MIYDDRKYFIISKGRSNVTCRYTSPHFCESPDLSLASSDKDPICQGCLASPADMRDGIFRIRFSGHVCSDRRSGEWASFFASTVAETSPIFEQLKRCTPAKASSIDRPMTEERNNRRKVASFLIEFCSVVRGKKRGVGPIVRPNGAQTTETDLTEIERNLPKSSLIPSYK